jgi:hypothetical protein|tara:strand:+ start:23 stop:490 length:468 start_codon:yes stop_codon:yes gene_type:complete
MQNLLSITQNSPHSNIDSLIHKDSLYNLTIRNSSPDVPFKRMEYVGSDKIDDLIEYINYLSKSTKGGFGQDLKPLSYWDMPEASRFDEETSAKLYEKGWMSIEEMNELYENREMETSTKAAILYDLLERNQYDYGTGGVNVKDLRSDYLSDYFRK